MRTITKFLAVDNTEFATEAACIAYEQLCDETQARLATLLPVPRDNNFLNGRGFVQQEKSAALALQRWLIDKISAASGELLPGMRQSETPVGMTIIGRFANDSAPGPIRAAWWRIQCMDGDFREYGQPFYAIEANRKIQKRMP